MSEIYYAKILNKELLNFECLLNEMELRSLGFRGCKYNKKKGLQISSINGNNLDTLKERATFISSVNNIMTNYCVITQKKYKQNPNLFLTHWFYYYKGKFYPRLVRSLINIIKLRKDDTLMDPFMGSGTAAIEAQTLGINFIGLDVSPLCKIITDAKASSIYCIDEIERVQDILSKYYCNFKFINRDYYYNLLNELTDEYAAKCFFTLVRLNALKYVLDTSKYSMAYSYYTDNMISYLKYFDYVRNYLNLKLGMAVSYPIDSRQGMEFIENDSIDGIITSPPYFNALNYLDNEKLALLDLNFDDKPIRNNFIGLRQNTSDVYCEYENDLFKVYSGMYRCMKKNKYAVIIIGNNYFKGKSVRNTESNINAMNKSGFRLVENIPTDPYLNNKSVFRENILIFQK